MLILLALGCSNYEKKTIQGYIEGEYTQLSSPVSGRLTKLAVDRGDYVNQGQFLFSLEPQPELEQYQRSSAQADSAKAQYQDALTGQRSTIILALIAQRDQAQANLDLSRKNFARYEILYKKGAISKLNFDEAQANLKAAQRRVDELEANIEEAQLGQRQYKIISQYDEYKASQFQQAEAKWRLQQKNVYAPDKGLVFDTFFTEGEQVSAYHAVVSLLSPENIYVLFFVPEVMRSKLRVGENIMFTCDSCEEHYPAKINFISSQAEYTPPVIFSRESREKLVYRVRATLPEWVSHRVYAGQPVEVFFRKEAAHKENNVIINFGKNILNYFSANSIEEDQNGKLKKSR